MFKKLISLLIITMLLSVNTVLNPIKITIAKGLNIQNTATISTLSTDVTLSQPPKEEVIYGKLNSSGGVDGLYVVNSFEIDKETNIIDYGKYELTKNLTSNEDLILNNDSVTFTSNDDKFYYQGNLEDKVLPWDFEINYTLDNNPINPNDLAGKKGLLKIEISTQRNPNVNLSFYKYFMLQLSVTLDTNNCSNISSTGSTVANAGTNKIFNYTIMPNTDSKIILSADVKDFEMEGISIAALPFSMDIAIPNTDNLVDDLNELSEAISLLNEGSTELNDAVLMLKNGSSDLNSGADVLDSGLKSLNQNSTSIVDGSKKIKTALNTINKQLSSSNTSIPTGSFSELPQGLNELSEGLNSIATGLKDLNDGLSLAYTSLDSAMQGIPKAISEKDLGELYTENYGNPTFDLLVEHYKSSLTIKGTYEQVKPAFIQVNMGIESIISNIETISTTITTISAGLDESLSSMDALEQLPELIAGLATLSNSYDEFHQGLKEYTGGVSSISTGYKDINSGIGSFDSAISELYKGTNELSQGTNELNTQTQDMPKLINDSINNLLSSFDTSEYKAISFTSPLNTNIKSVQFVLTSDSIKKEVITIAKEVEIKDTLWDRFINLFK